MESPPSFSASKSQRRIRIADEPPYDPLNYDNLGASIYRALMERVPIPINNLPVFNGAGIYAIYYTGEHRPYASYDVLAAAHHLQTWSKPIYVGKADPPGVRTGGRDLGNIGSKLADRMNQHASSIRATSTTLSIDDFWCRYLIVEPVWIPLGEAIVINLADPLWNVVVDGFGNHAPGKGRDKGMKPRWDTLHPGRRWAERLPDHSEDAASIRKRIDSFFAGDTSARLLDVEQASEANSDERKGG